MTRAELLQFLKSQILELPEQGVRKVCFDGIDGAGKTTLANELLPVLEIEGLRIHRASIDGFHHPREYRYQKGALSPEGYYQDSFDYDFLTKKFLEPLISLKEPRELVTARFDWKSDESVEPNRVLFRPGDILLFEGVFLQRPELVSYWDLKVFVDIPFELSLERGLKRDSHLLGGEQATRTKYQERYIPGQKIYFGKVNPRASADVVIDNSCPSAPKLVE